MIGKLRKKFIITAFSAVAALLFTILLVINVVNFALVTADADKVTEMLLSHSLSGAPGANEKPVPMNAQGDVPPEFNRDFGRKQFGPSSPETGESTRYFTLKISPSGESELVEYRISIVSEAEAEEWGLSLADKKNGWTKTSYRYLVREKDGSTYVTVVDQSREMNPSLRVLWASLIGGLVGLIVTFLALLPISKRMVKPIEDNDRKQKQFILNASHELKTPLTVIDTNRRILELNDGEKESTKAIGNEVSYLMDFTKKLDALTSLESDEKHPSFKEIDLSTLVSETALPYKRLFESRNKSLETEIESGVPVTGDVTKLSLLCNVLLENALRYAESKARLTLKKSGERIEIECRNDAKNIVEGDLDSVFEKFYRSEDVKQSGIEGAGIGLSIVRDVVSLHGGRIMARGENGFFVLKIEL